MRPIEGRGEPRSPPDKAPPSSPGMPPHCTATKGAESARRAWDSAAHPHDAACVDFRSLHCAFRGSCGEGNGDAGHQLCFSVPTTGKSSPSPPLAQAPAKLSVSIHPPGRNTTGQEAMCHCRKECRLPGGGLGFLGTFAGAIRPSTSSCLCSACLPSMLEAIQPQQGPQTALIDL